MKEIVFLGMGGTISGIASSSHDNVGYRPGQISIDALVDSAPGLADALSGFRPLGEQVAQLDSKDLEPAHWVTLAERITCHLARDSVRGVVVTHGTDTLEETAFFLEHVLPDELIRHKPVVLTCAMRPASSVNADGPGNLLDASLVAMHADAKGVLVVCAGLIHQGEHVQKVHTYRVNPFDPGEVGPLGCLEEGRLRLFREWPGRAPRNERVKLNGLVHASWPWVEIVTSHAGAHGNVVHAMLAASESSDRPLRGLVVAGSGNGTMHHRLEYALHKAHEAGVRVVRTTRCAQGRVVASEGADPRSSDAFTPVPLPPVKARIALMLDLLA